MNFFNNFQFGKTHHHRPGQTTVAPSRKRHIRSGDKTNLLTQRLNLHPFRQPLLQRDGLLDVRYLCYQLQTSNDSSRALSPKTLSPETQLYDRVFQRFSPEQQKAVNHLAEQYVQNQRSHIATLDLPQRNEYDIGSYDEQLRRSYPITEAPTKVLAALNQILLWQNFYQSAAFSEIRYEKEVSRLVDSGAQDRDGTVREA